MVIAFIILLILAIWAAFHFGGVRKAPPEPEKPEPDKKDGPEKMEGDEDEPFKGKGGKFGGGGASGDW